MKGDSAWRKHVTELHETALKKCSDGATPFQRALYLIKKEECAEAWIDICKKRDPRVEQATYLFAANLREKTTYHPRSTWSALKQHLTPLQARVAKHCPLYYNVNAYELHTDMMEGIDQEILDNVKFLQVNFEEIPLTEWEVRYAKQFKNLKKVYLVNGFDRADQVHIYDLYESTMLFLAKLFPKKLEHVWSDATTNVPHADTMLLHTAQNLKHLTMKGRTGLSQNILNKLGPNLIQLHVENVVKIEAEDWVNFAKRAKNLRQFELNDMGFARTPLPAGFWQSLPKEMTVLKASENKNLKPEVLSSFKKLTAVELSQEMILRKQIQTKLVKRLKDLDVFDIDTQKIKQLGIVIGGLKLVRLGLRGKFGSSAFMSLMSNIPKTVEEVKFDLNFFPGNGGNPVNVDASKLTFRSLKKVEFRLTNLDTPGAEIVETLARTNPNAGGKIIIRFFNDFQGFKQRMGPNYAVKWG